MTTLAEHKEWLHSIGAAHIHDCPCRFEVKSLGRGWGKGWVRMDTVPSCPEHGWEAMEAWRARQRVPSQAAGRAHNCRFEYCTAPTGECQNPE